MWETLLALKGPGLNEKEGFVFASLQEPSKTFKNDSLFFLVLKNISHIVHSFEGNPSFVMRTQIS